MKHWLLSLLLFPLLALAALPQPLPMNQAFAFSAQFSDTSTDTVQLTWRIAPGHHLYRQRLKFILAGPGPAQLAPINLPEGKLKKDEILGRYQVYQHTLTIPVHIKRPTTQNTATLNVHYQGCSEAGYCYPPTTQQLKLNLKKQQLSIEKDQFSAPSQDHITALLTTSHLWIILISFLGFGVLLSFTPCVLPMIPILSGIILGQRDTLNTRRALALSLTYVLAMACTYALAGLIIGYFGHNIQTLTQTPWILTLFSLVFVAMALSLFDVYHVRLPHALHQKLHHLHAAQSSGTYLGVAVMGVLATVIVSPCVTPPLVGALSYISQTGNAELGALALFTLGLGMGIPLVIIGTLGGKFLPNAGPWMHTIKTFFGLLLLGVAIWLLERIVPGPVALLLWASLLIFAALMLGIFTQRPRTFLAITKKMCAIVLFLYGVILIVGAATGNQSLFQPLRSLESPAHDPRIQRTATLFTPIHTHADLQRALINAKHHDKPTLLDFYADWCIVCKKYDRNVFSNPKVRTLMRRFVLLQADVTRHTAEQKALQAALSVIAPPTMIFFNKKGIEIPFARVIGEMNVDDFAQHLTQILDANG